MDRGGVHGSGREPAQNNLPLAVLRTTGFLGAPDAERGWEQVVREERPCDGFDVAIAWLAALPLDSRIIILTHPEHWGRK